MNISVIKYSEDKGQDGLSLDKTCLASIRDRWPEDYDKLRSMFPLIDVQFLCDDKNFVTK